MKSIAIESPLTDIVGKHSDTEYGLGCLHRRKHGIYTIAYWIKGKHYMMSTRTRNRETAEKMFKEFRDQLRLKKYKIVLDFRTKEL